VTGSEVPPLPRPAELPAIVFRALYPGFELRTIGTTYVVTPAGTPVFAGPSLGEIARQISGRAS
jgi:hypothetical protein